jgi:hypothetical protein
MREGVKIFLLENLLIRNNGEGVLNANSMLKKMKVVCISLAGMLVLVITFVCENAIKHDYAVIHLFIMSVICF